LGTEKVELNELLRRADVVSLHAPANKHTYQMLNAEGLAMMKDDALLINTGRGTLIDEVALVQELANGRFFAFLDVTDPEPLPADHVLWGMPNVLITPHSSSVSSGGSPDAVAFIRENIRRYAHGEKMLNVVDPALGY